MNISFSVADYQFEVKCLQSECALVLTIRRIHRKCVNVYSSISKIGSLYCIFSVYEIYVATSIVIANALVCGELNARQK